MGEFYSLLHSKGYKSFFLLLNITQRQISVFAVLSIFLLLSCSSGMDAQVTGQVCTTERQIQPLLSAPPPQRCLPPKPPCMLM